MKKETLEEAAEKYCEKVWGGYKDDVFKHDDIITDKTLSEISKEDFTEGAKWQQERMYNRKDMIKLIQFIVSQESLENTSSVSETTAKYYLKLFENKH